MTSRIPISDISYSMTQTRVAINIEAVADYAERMQEGDKFPPIRVFTLDRKTYHLARGLHRLLAAKKCGFVAIDAEVKSGDVNDAIMDGCQDNLTHGVRRTNSDKQRAVKMFLKAMTAKGENLSDSEIANRVGVDHKTVAKYRDDLGISQLRTGANGRAINTANIGMSTCHASAINHPESEDLDSDIADELVETNEVKMQEDDDLHHEDIPQPIVIDAIQPTAVKQTSEDEWNRFLDAGNEIERLTSVMKENRPDSTHLVPARELCKKLVLILREIIHTVSTPGRQ